MPDPGAAWSFWLEEALPALTGLYGEQEGLRYALVLADSVAEAGEFCAANGIDCWFHLEGAMGVRAGSWQEGISRRSAIDLCARLGYGDRMIALSADETRARADSPTFVGGAFIRDAAVIQPARLARGLRRLLLERGVRIYERTRVTGVDRSRPAVVRTDHVGRLKRRRDPATQRRFPSVPSSSKSP